MISKEFEGLKMCLEIDGKMVKIEDAASFSIGGDFVVPEICEDAYGKRAHSWLGARSDSVCFSMELDAESLEQLQSGFVFGEPQPTVVTFEHSVWEQFRFPRSKKKRIRRKWARDKRNFRDRKFLTQHKMEMVDCVSVGDLVSLQLKVDSGQSGEKESDRSDVSDLSDGCGQKDGKDEKDIKDGYGTGGANGRGPVPAPPGAVERGGTLPLELIEV